MFSEGYIKVPLGPFDGRAAAIIKAFLYTTPNQDAVWVPGNTRDGVYLRADLRYGPHDPTLWPQLYVQDLCHLGAIPRKPIDPDHPLSIMWWSPTRGDFVSSEYGVLDGLGKLRSARYARFQTMKMEMENRVHEYRRNNPRPNNWVFALERTMAHACTRLGHLSTTFTQMGLGVTEFQRSYLELHGLLDYLEIYASEAYNQRQLRSRIVLARLLFRRLYSKTSLQPVYPSGSFNPVRQVGSHTMFVMLSPLSNL
jgi:hypothetical protein